MCVCVCKFKFAANLALPTMIGCSTRQRNSWRIIWICENNSFFSASLFRQLQQILTILQQTSCQPTKISLSYNIFYIVWLHICVVKCNLVSKLILAFLIGVQSHNWCRELKPGKTLKIATRIFQFSLCKKDQLTSRLKTSFSKLVTRIKVSSRVYKVFAHLEVLFSNS